MLGCFEDGLSSAQSVLIPRFMLVAGVLLVGEHGLSSAAVLIAAYRHVITHGM